MLLKNYFSLIERAYFVILLIRPLLLYSSPEFEKRYQETDE